MPELPEVETVRRGLSAAMQGRRIVRVEQRRADLRFPFPPGFATRLEGRRVAGLSRRAKYLLCRLDGPDVLLMHLGMSGRFTVIGEDRYVPGRFHRRAAAGERHEHVVIHLDDGVRIAYADHRRFGFMLLVPAAQLETFPLLQGLGPEPLGADFQPRHLARALAGRVTSLKAALVDQRIVAGLGNIYACEALHRARLSPRRRAGTLAGARGEPGLRARRLAGAVRAVLEEAIEAGGSSLRDFAHADGELGYFQTSFAVYDREGEPCPRPACGGRIRRIVQGGRSTFYCPACQR